MKRIIFILTLFLFLLNPCFAAGVVKKDISVQSVDGFTIKATFEYPKVKSQKEFSTVVLLHSLGYTSEWWETLPKDLLNEGYAVLRIDLRGHGKSVYNSKLVRNSWKSMTNNAFAKYPDDVVQIIEHIRVENPKKIFFVDWAIIGSDIGANTAIIAADKIAYKPKTLVLLTPSVKTRGLYTPVSLAHLTDIDIFSITGKDDLSGKEAEKYLQKFAQATFTTYTSEANCTGMLMLKNDNTLSRIITSWIKQYL